jgi:hypothetical protein
MKKLRRFLLIPAVILLCFQVLQAQVPECDKPVEAGLYDMGKMWTFDYPPSEYFRETYKFNSDQRWFDEARLSALRFADYCSASFVSADGLVMTNHHCARESGFAAQRKGESIVENGFYAKKLGDERKVEGLYVDQLVKIEDITERVLNVVSKQASDSAKLLAREKELALIEKEYKGKEDWKGLELETIQFYDGGKFSLYGFKRYSDVRLVFMPETQVAYFGGDYDNFTYPRYDLDCSFFRVYDNDKPLKAEHYFKYNVKGASEGDAVFVIGNPGSTQRLSTISDLEFYRDMQVPFVIEMLGNLSKMYQDYNAEAKNDSITNLVFTLENSLKVYRGEQKSLRDPCIMAQKAAFEKKFKNDAKAKASPIVDTAIWSEIQQVNDDMRKIYDEYVILNVSGRFTGKLMQYALMAVALDMAGNDTTGTLRIRKAMSAFNVPAEMNLEEQMFAIYLRAAVKILGKDHPFVQAALNGRTPEDAAKYIYTNTRLKDREFRNQLLAMDSISIMKVDDPMVNIARLAELRSEEISQTYSSLAGRILTLHSQLGRMLFEIYGTNIPPDATFSLRINDGVVKGYEYNGTIAPVNTTFYGLYDRYNSFGKKFPYNLPSRWQNPSEKLLPMPLDFITTNDVVGGNSGSPMINSNLEVVGLVFDGNIESLAGNFIFMPDVNRTIGVHSQAIVSALRYIYNAERLLNELSGK